MYLADELLTPEMQNEKWEEYPVFRPFSVLFRVKNPLLSALTILGLV